ncbi:hypothetical protein M434DRAFT_22025 [Hypoxylon sp. CO27-5]|nr:hypothetical protein M434DRAFT_22025 [Hypoxylon sp. CO27-5]
MDTVALFRVDGMIAVITGGGSGIGLMIAKALAGAGASKVYLLRRQQDELRKGMFEEVLTDDFTNTLNMNVTGAYFIMLAFLELLNIGNKNALRGGFGATEPPGSSVVSIQSQVIFTSNMGVYSRDPLSLLAYLGSKAALSHLAKHVSINLSKYKIRVNVLAPGLFPSNISSDMTFNRDPGAERHGDRLFIPSRRFGGIEEIGGSVLYLASRAGSYCNGLILLNDGGRLSVMLSEY